MITKINLVLYLGLWPGQKWHSKVMHRKEVTHSNSSYERKLRGRKLADEMGRAKKSHDTLIDWRTGRECPVNCMTVISAWWRLNMRFQRSSGRSSGRWTIILLSQDRSQGSWSELETRCFRESHTRPKGLGSLMNWGPEKMLIRCRKESRHPAEWTPGPPVGHQENKKDATLTAISVGGRQNNPVLFGLLLPLTRKPWVTLFIPLQ